MTSERTRALWGLWRTVNEIATTTNDEGRIRAMIAEAGVEPNIHLGIDESAFTPEMVAEFMLGQWADMIDTKSPFAGATRRVLRRWEFRNLSFKFYDEWAERAGVDG